MEKTKEELMEELKKTEEELEKRDEELEERRRLKPDVEALRKEVETCHISNVRSSKKSELPTAVSKLQEICAKYESLKLEYIAMGAVRKYEIGVNGEFAEEERYQEIEDELVELEPEYVGAKHQLALPSTIARNIKLWSKFTDEEILRIPARLFGTLFKDESVQPESAIGGVIMRKANNIKYHQSMSCMKETIMNEVMSLLELTGFDFHSQYHLDKDKGRMDGFSHLHREPVVIVEGELPDSSGDPLMHGFVCYKRANDEYVDYLAQFNKKPRKESFPCLIITTNGELFSVYGAFTLQTEQRKERRQGPGFAYSFIRAFSVCQPCDAICFISWLKKKMEDLMSSQSAKSPSVLSCFPHDCVPEVIFKQHLRDNLFEGRMKDSNKKCIVKFLFSGYGKEVHEYCASFSYAPKILKTDSTSADGSSPIVIVMEKDDTFKTLCDSLEQKKVEAPEKVCENLRNAVEAMQTKGFVHGNIRPPNVLSNNQGDVWLIDFDWAGREGHPNVTYPYPPGAAFGEKIKMEHDTNMMEEVISQIRSIR